MESTSSEVKARKKHVCEVCSWVIEPGEKYRRDVTFDAGSVSVWKAHLTPCATASDRAWLDCYFDEGMTAEDVAYWAEEVAPDDPVAIELNRRLRINYEKARAAMRAERERKSA